VIFEDVKIGGLVLYHTVRADSRRTPRVLGRVSEQAAAVIHNSTRFEQTEHESQTDPLTGLPNGARSIGSSRPGWHARRSTGPASASSCSTSIASRSSTTPTATKSAIGRCARVGNVLRSTVRESDLRARFAGDEFIVVLCDCSPDHEARRVSEVQNAVSAYPFEPRPGVRVSLSISAGAARFPEDGSTFEELLTAADERMYHDKAGRRSRNSGRHALAQAERA